MIGIVFSDCRRRRGARPIRRRTTICGARTSQRRGVITRSFDAGEVVDIHLWSSGQAPRVRSPRNSSCSDAPKS
jgi:hypothetical protein